MDEFEDSWVSESMDGRSNRWMLDGWMDEQTDGGGLDGQEIDELLYVGTEEFLNRSMKAVIKD